MPPQTRSQRQNEDKAMQEVSLSLNWLFLEPEKNHNVQTINIPYPLFNQMDISRKLFADRLQEELGFQADIYTMKLWMPILPLPIESAREKVKETMNKGLDLGSFAKEIGPVLPLSMNLDGQEKNNNIVHIIVTAEPRIFLNWCFFSSEYSIIGIRVTEIPGYLFNRPSQFCRELFSDLLQSEFKFRAHVNTIHFLMPKDLLSVTRVEEGKDQLLRSGLQDFVKKTKLVLSMSTILEGKEKDASILHFFVCAERADEDHGDHDESGDELVDLPESARFKRMVVAKRKVPSTELKLVHYRNNQRSNDTRIYDGYYPSGSAYSTIAPPIELYHPIFNRFIGLMESSSPTVDDLIRTRQLMGYLGELSFVDESVRNQIINQQLRGILHQNIQPSQNTDTTMTDEVISVRVGEASVPLLLAEFKKSLGEGSCDPCVQASLSMQRKWNAPSLEKVLLKCCCPTFLLVGGGPWLGILGAVWTDRVIVQPLIGLRWFGIGSTEEFGRIWKNAQILLTLRHALQELQQFYLEDLADVPVHTTGPHPRFYPYPTSYMGNNERVEFKYLEYLDKEEYTPCVTFLAEVVSAVVAEGLGGQTKVSVGEKIVVKYVSRYGKEVHEFLAGRGHAPELLHYGPLPDSQNFTSREGGSKEFGFNLVQRNRMYMVVMRHTCAQPSFKLSPHCREQLKKILFELHAEGYVFGDLRNQNVLVDDSSSSVKLIDFNWCGEYDTGKESSLNGVPEEVKKELKGRLKPRVGPYTCYPLSISMDPQMNWADGVGPLEPILPGHDWIMLEKLS